MLRSSTLVVIAVLGILTSGCPETEDETRPNPLLEVPESASWSLPCLQQPVHVVRTEHDVPHIYAETEQDLACAQGFVTARDRFFQMDLIARAGLGTVAEIFGGGGLSSDIDTRSRGGRMIADQLLESTTSEERATWTAYADGVNAYIDRVRSGEFPPPAELEASYLFLGVESPADLMVDWGPLHLAGVASTVNFVSGFETTDIKNQEKVDQLADYGTGLPESQLRHDGAVYDIWENIAPVYPAASGHDFGQSAEAREADVPRRPTLVSGPRVEQATLSRAVAVAERLDRRPGRTGEPGFGSNAWAIGPELTEDGVAVLGSDGHLALTVPAFLYNTHLDTQLLGDGDMHAIGITIAGAPMIGLGTNGRVAWGHTSQVSDINDYYRDEVVLGSDGRPAATLFQGDEIPLVEVAEDYAVSAALGATAGIQSISRWVTGQGRPVFSLEGASVDGPEDNPAAVNIFGSWIVAGDQDADGVITAITGAASHFSERHMVRHVRGWETADDVDEWAQHLAGMTSYSQHFIVADTAGNILYTGFQGMPCRSYLPKEADGTPVAGANPQLLIDGTLYPSFEVTYDTAGFIDPAPDSDLNCTVPYEAYPHARNPDAGYVVNSNNAPWYAAWDNNLWNDSVYIGGPWYGTWRSSRIIELIEEGAGTHSVETVSNIQADHRSRMATEFLPLLLDTLERAAELANEDELIGTEARIAAAYPSRLSAIEEAHGRLTDWNERGRVAASGVETFYDTPSATDVQDSIATTIFNAWMGRFQNAVFDDEGLPSIFRPTSSYGKTRTLKALVDGVGADNPGGLASWNPATGESAFFDVVGTDEKESRDELVIVALVDALDYLATPFGGDRSGGYNTTDQSQWLWGLKHFVHFDSFVAREIGDDPLIASVFSDISITPAVLPLADPPPSFGDARLGLPGFPRPGDAFSIDAAGGIGTHNYGYGSGPVMRMSIAMDPDGIRGVNVLPGGQSAQPDSPFFADQAALWLANEAFPIRFAVDDVIAGATGREVLSP